MTILAWNCCGLGDVRSVNLLFKLYKLENPDFIFLSETKLKQWEYKAVDKKFVEFNKVYLDCDGRGNRRKGGLCFLWKRDVIDYLCYVFFHHIDVSILYVNWVASWCFKGTYGWPKTENKHKTGSLLDNWPLLLLCHGFAEGIF